MAKIIYGINSDGLGHYSRSKLVIDHLIEKGHKVKILTADRAYELLKDKYDAEKISRVAFTYKNNKINYVSTLYDNFIKSPELINKGLLRVRSITKEFNPDLIISDFEIFTSTIAGLKKIPFLCIDNIHSLTHTLAPNDVKKYKHKIYESEAKALLKIMSPRSKYCKRFMITTFFESRVKKNKKATLIPSLIRNEILKIKDCTENNHVLVYQTSKTNKDLLPALKGVPSQKFIVYGFNKDEIDGNVVFKKTSIDNSFINDLCSAKAIITNGGFSLISEAVFLHKPVLSNPLKDQFEQILNATEIEKLGYGRFVERLSADNIKSFLFDINTFKKNLESYTQMDNSESFSKIDKEIQAILDEKEKIYHDEHF